MFMKKINDNLKWVRKVIFFFLFNIWVRFARNKFYMNPNREGEKVLKKKNVMPKKEAKQEDSQ